MVRSFLDFLSNVDREVVMQALNTNDLAHQIKTSLTNILSRFNCRDLPTPHNLRPMLIDVAEQLFLFQPFATVTKINCDVSTRHRKFWSSI